MYMTALKVVYALFEEILQSLYQTFGDWTKRYQLQLVFIIIIMVYSFRVFHIS